MSEMVETEELINEVWNKGTIVPNVNPESYRKDEYGAWIRRCRYNETNFPLSFGWSLREVHLPDGKTEYKPFQWQNAIYIAGKDSRQRVTSEGFYNKYMSV